MRVCTIGLILAVAFLGAASVARADWDGQWQKLENDETCKIWNDNSQRGSNVTWSGPCVNGRAEGQGIAVRKNFTAGQWKESRFEGELEGGKAHGQGTWIGPDGERYEGEWKDGLWDGQGITLFSNGDRFEGSHQKGVFDGLGTYIWSDGDRYLGGFKVNQMHGYGVYIYSAGGLYEGEWTEGTKNGQGKRTWADGSQFEGNFVAGNPHGDGKCRNTAGEPGVCRYAHGEFIGWQ